MHNTALADNLPCLTTELRHNWYGMQEALLHSMQVKKLCSSIKQKEVA